MLFDESSINNLKDGKTLSGLEWENNPICRVTGFSDYNDYWMSQIEASFCNLNDVEIAELLNESAKYAAIDEVIIDAPYSPKDTYFYIKLLGAYMVLLIDDFVKEASQYKGKVKVRDELKESLKEGIKQYSLYWEDCSLLINSIWQYSSDLRLLQSNAESPVTVRANAKKAAIARHAKTRGYKEEAFIWFKENGRQLTADQAAQEVSKRWGVALRTAMGWVSGFRKEIRAACK